MAQTPIQTSYTDTAPVAFAGMFADESDHDVAGFYNTGAAEIPFGFCVARDNTSPYDALGNGAALPALAGDKLAGIVAHSHAYGADGAGFLGTAGLKQNAMMNVLRVGKIWAICEDGCNPGDRLFVRYTAAGTGKGSLRSTDAGGSTCIDATTKGEWQTKAAALGLAVISVDFVAK